MSAATTACRIGPRGLAAEEVPGDGACLFHSVGRHVHEDAGTVRRHVVNMLQRSPSMLIEGDPVSQWTEWYADKPIAAYIPYIARATTWGGALELALLARWYGRPIHVYEPTSAMSGCRKISEFSTGRASTSASVAAEAPPIRLLYVGRAHYMPLFAR